MPDTDDIRIFMVVQNNEEQYSIWWVDREVPAGWQEAGMRGSRQECLDYINRVWTDMRPVSVRRSMDEQPNG